MTAEQVLSKITAEQVILEVNTYVESIEEPSDVELAENPTALRLNDALNHVYWMTEKYCNRTVLSEDKAPESNPANDVSFLKRMSEILAKNQINNAGSLSETELAKLANLFIILSHSFGQLFNVNVMNLCSEFSDEQIKAEAEKRNII